MEELLIFIGIIALNFFFGVFNKKKKDSGEKAGGGFPVILKELKNRFEQKSGDSLLSDELTCPPQERVRGENRKTRQNRPRENSYASNDSVTETKYDLPFESRAVPVKKSVKADILKIRPVQNVETKKVLNRSFHFSQSDLKRGIILAEILAPCAAKRRKSHLHGFYQRGHND